MKSFRELRIVFFGTPDFAVASLNALKEAGANIVAVVTAPDKPAGRGRQLQESPVKQYAVSAGIPVMQPEKMKAPEFLVDLRALNADLQIVVAFRMMPEVVWNMPPMGTINVHGSLLPQYRGAAPINRAIMNGETVTGVTTFKLKHEIDTGDILLQRSLPIGPDDNMGTMYEKLMLAGAELLVETVHGLADGTLHERPQDNPKGGLKHAPKIFREDMLINWSHDAVAVHNQVRGLSPYPAAATELAGKNIKVFRTHFGLTETSVTPGTWQTDHQTYLRFAANDGWVYIDDLQMEGKKRMEIKEFLRGFRS
ncbi:MAG: methionyl-tRNA formyltransferase [Taibaiella sp.]|nr:methionyl-tRNA formyltransferase [Taibaiella sp.]